MLSFMVYLELFPLLAFYRGVLVSLVGFLGAVGEGARGEEGKGIIE